MIKKYSSRYFIIACIPHPFSINNSLFNRFVTTFFPFRVKYPFLSKKLQLPVETRQIVIASFAKIGCLEIYFSFVKDIKKKARSLLM